MRLEVVLAIIFAVVLSGCSASPSLVPAMTSVVPSSSGTPNTVAMYGDYEFVSVQGTGQIVTYNISSGWQEPVGLPYATPCIDPSGMVTTSVGGSAVMAVVCFDTGSLLTLRINSDGSLSPLGEVGGLETPYPGIVLDGTNVLVPLFGQVSAANGGVAKISIASPAQPVLVAVTMLANPQAGAFSNPGYLAVANGYIFVEAGSDDQPADTTSTIQVMDEASMQVVGAPLVVEHSPQQIVIEGSVAYVTVYDGTQLESIDISDPTNLKPLQVLTLSGSDSNCHPLPIAVVDSAAFVGCYPEGTIEEFDVSNPADMKLKTSVGGIAFPQRVEYTGHSLLVPSSTTGGSVYQLELGEPLPGGAVL
jgi:LVIVD repeat